MERGGGGVRARGGDLTAKSISSVGGLIEYLCSGVGTFNFFRQRDWDQDKAWLTGIVFLGFGMAWVSEKVSFLSMFICYFIGHLVLGGDF